jgi:hypothetical protein
VDQETPKIHDVPQGGTPRRQKFRPRESPRGRLCRGGPDPQGTQEALKEDPKAMMNAPPTAEASVAEEEEMDR